MKNNPLLNRIRENRLFWPLVALALILIFDAFYAPGFFKIGILEGHLYGNLIDVLNDGAPLMLVAIGMTMVIATGGVDLSVGAVIAISGAMGAVLINPSLGNQLISNAITARDASNTPLPLIVLADLAAGTLCGLWNGIQLIIQADVIGVLTMNVGTEDQAGDGAAKAAKGIRQQLDVLLVNAAVKGRFRIDPDRFDEQPNRGFTHTHPG